MTAVVNISGQSLVIRKNCLLLSLETSQRAFESDKTYLDRSIRRLFPKDDSTQVVSAGFQKHGGWLPILLYRTKQFFSCMETSEKLATDAQGALKSRKSPRNGQSLYSRLLIEKDAKNMAYAFILSRGLLSEFVAHSYAHQGDAHSECVSIILEDL